MFRIYILGTFCGFIIVGVPIGLGIALWGQLPKNRTIKSIHDMNIRPLLLHQSPLVASVVDNPNVFYTTTTLYFDKCRIFNKFNRGKKKKK